MFTGTYTAIVTPFKNGKIDEAALERLIAGAGPGRRGRDRAGRHHGRIADGGLRRAHPHHRAVGEVCARPNQGARRHGRQFHQRGDLPDPNAPKRPGPTARSRWRLTTTSRRRRASSSTSARWRAHTRLPIVLYSIPGRCGIEIGVDTVKRLAQRVQEHHRHQGSGRQRGPREPVARGAGAALRDHERRRLAHPAVHGRGRARRHQRGLQCHPAPGRADGQSLCRRQDSAPP